MKNNLFDKLKEALQQAPMLNLSNINATTLPQITTGLNNIVKTQNTLKQQQQQLVQQQQKPPVNQAPQPQQAIVHEDDAYPGSVDGTGESKAYEPKSLPATTTPTMGSSPDLKAMGMKDMAADSMPILEDEPEIEEPEQPAQEMRIEDHINELLTSLFGFKYYFGKHMEKPNQTIQKKDIQGSLFPNKQPEQKIIPYWEKLGGARQEQLMSDRNFAHIMKLLDFDKFPDALNALIRFKEINLQENFVKSEIFTIIAENETPKISKGELISYLKNRNL